MALLSIAFDRKPRRRYSPLGGVTSMSGRQDNYVIELLERAFLVQQKRVWSLEMLDKLARKQVLAKGTDEQREKLRRSLDANLRISKVVLDEIAKELGYE